MRLKGAFVRYVIDHVPDVLGFLNELHDITKPGGKSNIVTESTGTNQSGTGGNSFGYSDSPHKLMGLHFLEFFWAVVV